jgi:hypothetical protein
VSGTVGTITVETPFSFPGKFNAYMPGSTAPMNMPAATSAPGILATDDIFNLNHVLTLVDGLSLSEKVLTDGGVGLTAGQLTAVGTATGANQLVNAGPSVDGSGDILMGTASISSTSGSASASFGSFITGGGSLGSIQFFDPSSNLHSMTLTPSATPTAAFTLNLPNTGANDTLAALAYAQTLSSKTLNDALFVDGANSNATLFTTSGVASAMNYFQISNAASGSGPQIAAVGVDPAINATVSAKGAGSVIALGAALVVPSASGAAPTASAALAYDTTGLRYAVGDGVSTTTYPTVSWPAQLPSSVDLICSTASGTVGGNTCKNSGGTTETPFATSLSLPSGFLAVAGKTIRLNFHFLLYTGGSPPTLLINLRWNNLTGSIIFSSPTLAPAASQSGYGFLATCLITATATPSSSSPILADCTFNVPGWTSTANTTTQPVTVATNTSRTPTVTVQWGTSGISGTGLQLQSLIPEVLQ